MLDAVEKATGRRPTVAAPVRDAEFSVGQPDRSGPCRLGESTGKSGAGPVVAEISAMISGARWSSLGKARPQRVAG